MDFNFQHLGLYDSPLLFHDIKFDKNTKNKFLGENLISFNNMKILKRAAILNINIDMFIKPK